jgi:hypothetical protein
MSLIFLAINDDYRLHLVSLPRPERKPTATIAQPETWAAAQLNSLTSNTDERECSFVGSLKNHRWRNHACYTELDWTLIDPRHAVAPCCWRNTWSGLVFYLGRNRDRDFRD